MDNSTAQNYLIQSLKSPVTLMTILSFIGLFGNTCIIIVTITRRSLHNTCNILIAIDSFIDITIELFLLQSLYYIFTDNHYITVRVCWYIEMIPSTFTTTSVLTTLMIGIDRLLNIVAPVWARNIGKVKYLFLMLSLPVSISVFWAVISIQPMLVDAELLVVCTTLEFLRGNLKYFRSYINIAICIIMVSVYAYIWFLVKTTQKVSSTTKKILKSLTVITIINASTWPVSQGFLLIARFIFDPGMLVVIAAYGGTIYHIGFAANFFIYLIFSSEYRAAFRQLFSCLPCVEKNQVNIKGHPLNIIHIRAAIKNNVV